MASFLELSKMSLFFFFSFPRKQCLMAVKDCRKIDRRSNGHVPKS